MTNPKLAGWYDRDQGAFLDLQQKPSAPGNWVPLYFAVEPSAEHCPTCLLPITEHDARCPEKPPTSCRYKDCGNLGSYLVEGKQWCVVHAPKSGHSSVKSSGEGK